MKMYRHLLLALLLLSAFSVNAENQSNPESESDRRDDRDWDRDRDRDRDRDHHRERCELKGTYSYELSGTIGPTSPASILSNEAGSITFDGKGQGSARGVSAISIPPFRLDPIYNFSYTWISPGVALATGTRASIAGVTSIQFAVGVGDLAEDISLVVLPNNPLIVLIPGAPIPPQAI